MTMPAQRPGKSRQDYETPPDLIEAVTRRWGPLEFDLAATAQNAKAPEFFTPARNALLQKWDCRDGIAWLNPPYQHIGKWARKCADADTNGGRILMLVPASIGSMWFYRHVWKVAHVIALCGRITFVGCSAPYPKDCMICEYGHPDPGFEVWKWNRSNQ